MTEPLPLDLAAAGVAGGTTSPAELLASLLSATVFCEAPDHPGVLTAASPQGPVVPVFTSLAALAAARGGVAWFSTSGQDLLDLVPAGHDLVLDPGGDAPLRLRPSALRPAVRVS